MKYMQTGWKQRGLTLVEVMVAMTIGLVLLGGIVTVMISSQNTYRVNESLARMQESARYAFQILSRDIRMAGYRGCVGDDGIALINLLNNNEDYLWKFDQPIVGFDATGANGWVPALPVGAIASPKGGRDILVLRGVEGGEVAVLSHPTDGLNVSSGSELQVDDTVLVSDCQAAAIFQVTGMTTSPEQDMIEHAAGGGSAPGNSAALSRKFIRGEVMRVNTRAYYIRNRAGSMAIPALYWKKGNQSAEELIEGIENMQIQYGVDENEDKAADIYQTAKEVEEKENWKNVVSVRIDLLVQSMEDGIATQPQVYTFNGETITPTDRRLRQVFSTVISLRNRTS